MEVEIKVPAMGESISQAIIGTFLKKNGDFVKVDEELIELETDKVNQVLYAPESGVVTWKVAPGDVVEIGKINDKVVCDWTQPDGFSPPEGHAGRKISSGTFALQGHDPKSIVFFKDIMVRPLP